MRHDFIISDNVWLSQKDNKNPDGTDNMTWSKKWARFNQCFIASATATYNQVCKRIVQKNKLDYKFQEMDEFNYLTSILKDANSVNGKPGASDKDNDKRFDWAFQTKFLNKITPKPIADLGTWVNCSFEEEAFKRSIRSGLQCVMGIWIKDYYPSGNGHVVSGIGWSEDDAGALQGIFINDPAGNILAKKSYYAEEKGKEIYLEKAIFKKIFVNKRQMIFFEEI